MPRRSILSATERADLLALPTDQDSLIRYYTLNESDLALIRQRRGEANRLGFAVQLCLLRYPGYGLLTGMTVPQPLTQWIARQLRINAEGWNKYAGRSETRREHLQELQIYMGLRPFRLSDFSATQSKRPTEDGL